MLDIKKKRKKTEYIAIPVDKELKDIFLQECLLTTYKPSEVGRQIIIDFINGERVARGKPKIDENR